ncbi:hypothetical protein TNCV_2516871 [Trichonephila clavipes]|nr:hypothetical protein TNCV_2516871 [Trichonephila clavipes]
MARYRVSNAQCMPHLPVSYTQARKNAVWICVSQKVPFTTLGHSQHLSRLQSIVDRPINTITIYESRVTFEKFASMEQSRVPESPLKDLVDSKPPIVSKSPDPPVKKAHVKKVDSVIYRSP